MKVVKCAVVWFAVFALYVYGVFLSSPSPADGAIVFAVSLWPILLAELARFESSKAVQVAMTLPLWGLSFIYLLQAAIGHPAPNSLPEEDVAAHVLFITSTAFFPGGLLAGFALKCTGLPEQLQRDYALEILLLSPWIVLYILLPIGRLL